MLLIQIDTFLWNRAMLNDRQVYNDWKFTMDLFWSMKIKLKMINRKYISNMNTSLSEKCKFYVK